MEEFIEGRDSRQLVVILHGLEASRFTLERVVKVVEAELPDADILVPRLAFGGVFGSLRFKPAETIAADLVRQIDAKVASRLLYEGGRPYEKIILVGHSYGAVLARKVAILAHGEIADAPFEPRLEDFHSSKKDWAGTIDRILLLAGMSRGWHPATARDWLTQAQWTLGTWIGEFLAAFFRKAPTLFAIRQGAPFIIQTRLQWLALVRSDRITKERKAIAAKRGVPVLPTLMVVQMLGTIDNMVGPEDAVDLSIDTAVTGQTAGTVQTTTKPRHDEARFTLLEMPATGHLDVVKMSAPEPQEIATFDTAMKTGTLRDVCRDARLAEACRGYIFGKALTAAQGDLDKIAIPREHMADTPALEPDEETDHVIFVIHGIRDRGFWAQKIARAIKNEIARQPASTTTTITTNTTIATTTAAATTTVTTTTTTINPIRCRSFTGSYGYFAMLPFVLPWVRRWKAAWLMDNYTEQRARYPNAQFSYVGHSNGTYLLARTLQDYPAVKFHRVVFVGSVVRRNYDWASLLPATGRLTVPDGKGIRANLRKLLARLRATLLAWRATLLAWLHATLPAWFPRPRVDAAKETRVSAVLNYVATEDWVVAIFPKGFQPFRWFFDLGSAGHDGFSQWETHANLHEARYVVGGHGAGIGETHWNDIAKFIVSEASPNRGEDFSGHQDCFTRLLGWISPVLVVGLVVGVFWIGCSLFNSIDGRDSAVIFGLYCWGAYLLFTRF